MTTVKAGWEERFLRALAKHGVVTSAAASARISRNVVYDRRRLDPVFASAWDDAIAQAADALEREAIRRAHEGVLKPVFQGGKNVGTIREYSDTLLIFLLKGSRPEKFRERLDMTSGGRAIVGLGLAELSDDEIDRRIEAITRGEAPPPLQIEP